MPLQDPRDPRRFVTAAKEWCRSPLLVSRSPPPTPWTRPAVFDCPLAPVRSEACHILSLLFHMLLPPAELRPAQAGASESPSPAATPSPQHPQQSSAILFAMPKRAGWSRWWWSHLCRVQVLLIWIPMLILIRSAKGNLASSFYFRKDGISATLIIKGASETILPRPLVKGRLRGPGPTATGYGRQRRIHFKPPLSRKPVLLATLQQTQERGV
eukprot:scaffold2042_cov295-Pinguiococcus_pyrenoidosus.AAC.7